MAWSEPFCLPFFLKAHFRWQEKCDDNFVESDESEMSYKDFEDS